jgi:hypothetical protein
MANDPVKPGTHPQGKFIGPFSDDDPIADPRGLGIEPSERLLFANSGTDCIGSFQVTVSLN